MQCTAEARLHVAFDALFHFGGGHLNRTLSLLETAFGGLNFPFARFCL